MLNDVIIKYLIKFYKYLNESFIHSADAFI